MFQKKQLIYSETQGVCQVDNIVNLSTGKGAKALQYYVLKPVLNPEHMSYIPVQNHQVELRNLFTREEAIALKESQKAKGDETLMGAVEYVLSH